MFPTSTNPFVPNKAFVLGYGLDCLTMTEALEKTTSLYTQGQAVQVVTLNPEMIMKGEETPAFGTILKQADVALPDGAGAVWALKRQGYVHQNRLPGIEFSEGLLRWCSENAKPVALLGSSPDVMAKTVETLQTKFSNLIICFSHHGFFETTEALEAVSQQLIVTQPALVLVALGVPKQEYWIAEHKPQFTTPVICVGVGGSFDVWSGLLQRAPQWMQKLNLEWLWRFSLQPWRIQRSVKPILTFLWRVVSTRHC
jgi:N-acetylglucosaminyldiphosphoundecaprenol N-acetyl-beta-D-mannosaminyltransferase